MNLRGTFPHTTFGWQRPWHIYSYTSACNVDEAVISVREVERCLTNLRKGFDTFFLAPQYLGGKILQHSQYHKHCFGLLQLSFMLSTWCLKGEFNKHFRTFCVSIRDWEEAKMDNDRLEQYGKETDSLWKQKNEIPLRGRELKFCYLLP